MEEQQWFLSADSQLAITVLVDNTAGGEGLLAEHGLAFWIERGNTKILFDTGQGMALEHNARKLHIPLEQVNAVVLSHGHYDHTGALDKVLDRATVPSVYAHPAAFEPKYSRKNNTVRYIGMGDLQQKAVRYQANIVTVKSPTEIASGIWCTGPIPRLNTVEDTGGDFYLDEKCTVADNLEDDQALYIQTEHGLVVVLGCAHSGVVNTLQYIRMLTDHAPIVALLGGMHLHSAREQRIRYTIDKLHDMKVEEIMPCHCSGFEAEAYMHEHFQGEYNHLKTGSRLQFLSSVVDGYPRG